MRIALIGAGTMGRIHAEALNRIEGVSMEYAMVEPRGKDVLAVIAPKDDMPLELFLQHLCSMALTAELTN